MKNESGFSLIEVLASLALISIVASGLVPSFALHSHFNNETHTQTLAAAAAQMVMDRLRLENPENLPLSGDSTETVSAGGKNFTIITSYCLRASYCTSKTRHIALQVTAANKTYFNTETVYTRLR
ncbi:MAG: type II secretion system protein [Candidatus Dadabacteria bacterium]|nr:MAG: type II secretion system protein [Candidatus Dadabacteria bacterium]